MLAEPGLRERGFGCFEGLRRDEVAQRFPQFSSRWHGRDIHFEPEGGESLSRFHERCLATVERLAQAHLQGLDEIGGRVADEPLR